MSMDLRQMFPYCKLGYLTAGALGQPRRLTPTTPIISPLEAQNREIEYDVPMPAEQQRQRE
jgi:hypothetical protein